MSDKESKPKSSSTMTFQGWYIPEPLLIFGDGKTHIDPKLGLTLYGPLKPEDSSASLMEIRLGIIGTGETIDLTRQFIDRFADKIPSENKDPFQNPSFPGFKNAFDCTLSQSSSYNSIITQRDIDIILKKPTFEEKVDSAVNLFLERIEAISESVPKPNVVICALPQEIVDYCAVKKTSSGEMKVRKTAQDKKFIEKLKKYKQVNQQFLDDFENTAEKILEHEILTSNFWRTLKAKAMKYDIPTQIVWPSTIARKTDSDKSRKKRQDDSSTVWNLAVALYYKGSGFPWTMTKMKKGTCYVGISFFKDLTDENKMRTSMAQIFTYTGEGLVLRGDKFEWDTNKDKTPHLTENSARELLVRAISLYKTRMKEDPTRVVVHKSSRYWEDEKRGFEDALKEIPYHDLIAFGNRGIRFFRYGKYPPLRGTVIQIAKNNYLLYTRGYIPYLRTYPGGHIPSPLELIEHFGDSPSQTILSEILALSKMNWNSAEFSLAQPITLLFSKRVGEVMASLPENASLKHEYRYYM